jgi:hypothetical protein
MKVCQNVKKEGSRRGSGSQVGTGQWKVLQWWGCPGMHSLVLGTGSCSEGATARYKNFMNNLLRLCGCS